MEEKLDKILGELQLLKENTKTLDRLVIQVVNIKEDLGQKASIDDFISIKDEILGEIDHFVKLHETLDTELSATRYYYNRLEDRVKVLERQAGVAV